MAGQEVVRVEYDAQSESPKAVTVRLTPAQAEFFEHMAMLSLSFVQGFVNHIRGEQDEEENEVTKKATTAIIRMGTDTAQTMMELVVLMHSQLNHPGQTCEEHMGADDGEGWKREN